MNKNLIELCEQYETFKDVSYNIIEQLYNKCPEYIYTDKYCYRKTCFGFSEEVDNWDNFLYESIKLDIKYGKLVIDGDTQEWLHVKNISEIIGRGEELFECESLEDLTDIEYKRMIKGINEEVERFMDRIKQLEEDRKEYAILYAENFGKKLKFSYEL